MHKIIALWSHPRSMSTAIERIMRERGDLICHHEPFMYDYYVNRKVREMPHFNVEPDRPSTFQDIRDMLLQDALKGPVFFKDMSYYVMPHLFDDKTFLNLLTHCFLIRNPVASILSYFKLDSEVSLHEIGLEAQWQHYSRLIESGKKPVIIEAEAVRKNTKTVIGAFWNAIELPYEEKGFEWQSEKPDDWSQVKGWHGDVMRSDGIRSPSANEMGSKNREFNELSRDHPHLRDYLDHHYPFYEKLRLQASSHHGV